MAKNVLRHTSNRLLNSTERKAIAKIMNIHEPLMKELEKWKEHREKVEEGIFDQIEKIGKFLEPYKNPVRFEVSMAGLKQPKAKYAGKKSAPKRASKPKRRTTKKSRSR